MVFYWSLSDNKSPQVFRTLFNILADLNNAVVWTVSTRPVISKSSSPCTNPLVTVPREQVLIPLFAFFQFYSVVRQNSKLCLALIFITLSLVAFYHNSFLRQPGRARIGNNYKVLTSSKTQTLVSFYFRGTTVISTSCSNI